MGDSASVQLVIFFPHCWRFCSYFHSLKMKIAVLGATGQTGQYLVSQALQGGHVVTALVRNPGKMTEKHDNLKVLFLPQIFLKCSVFSGPERQFFSVSVGPNHRILRKTLCFLCVVRPCWVDTLRTLAVKDRDSLCVAFKYTKSLPSVLNL